LKLILMNAGLALQPKLSAFYCQVDPIRDIKH
jgi:hypothetical protein